MEQRIAGAEQEGSRGKRLSFVPAYATLAGLPGQPVSQSVSLAVCQLQPIEPKPSQAKPSGCPAKRRFLPSSCTVTAAVEGAEGVKNFVRRFALRSAWVASS